MRQRAKKSKRVAKPSSANGGSSTALLPTAWRKPATGSSPSAVCRKANGAACEPRMRSNGSTKSSSAGSRRKPCCRPPTPPPCCSGRCWPPARSTCARSMDGRRSPKSSSSRSPGSTRGSISPPDSRHCAKWRGTYLATALGKLTSELPTSPFSRHDICFECLSTMRYLYVPEIAPRKFQPHSGRHLVKLYYQISLLLLIG